MELTTQPARRHVVVKNIGYLYLIQLLRLCLPIALLHILTRTLTSSQYSVYIYTLATSSWLSMFVEYAFNISATRRMAAAIEPSDARKVITETQSAKWLLVGFSLVFLVWATHLSAVFAPFKAWAACAWLLGVMIGMTPTYYYQASSNLRLIALLEVAGGIATLAGVLAFVKTSSNFGTLCAILILARLSIWQILERDMLSKTALRYRDLFIPRAGLTALKDGWQIFLVQVAASLYTSFNIVLLGSVSSAYAVAVYGSCERLIRAGLAFVAQATSALFPRMNALKATRSAELGRVRLLSLACFAIISVASLPFIYWLAPLISVKLLNDKFPDLTTVLRIMSLVVPAIAISNVLAFLYLVVDKKENIVNRIVFLAVPVSLATGYFFARELGAAGMAAVWVAIEWLVAFTLGSIIYIRFKRSQ